MNNYHELLDNVLRAGIDREDRTGTGSRAVFGRQMRFWLGGEEFPLLITKKVPFKLVASELLWFLKGNQNIDYLHEQNNHIWDEWVREDGTFGPIYGQQWRSWPDGKGGHIDQLAKVIEQLKVNPNSRRLLVSAWNVAQLDEMALPPCHTMFQFFSEPLNPTWIWSRLVEKNDPSLIWGIHKPSSIRFKSTQNVNTIHAAAKKAGIPARALSCQLYQRSADIFLGVPFNIASYSLLLHMVAQVTNHEPRDFVWTGGDIHLYHNHYDQAHELLGRWVKVKGEGASPALTLNPAITSIDDFTLEDMQVVGYNPMPAIPAPVAV
ncbi:thymidylate synthase [Ectothiorhodospira shaposhnikovii]|nr:thymidylate synthase [Ectothiorhodospira shaposhnikovii]MCG5512791.1 thymidylate synthase [Ectothiorhodospira shaposhnikovii]